MLWSVDLHQAVAAALLAGFDYGTLELLDHGSFGLNYRACGEKWDEASYAEFGQFFDEEVGAVAFRKGRGDYERKREFAINRHRRKHGEHNRSLADAEDFRGVVVAVAVEQYDAITGRANRAHGGEGDAASGPVRMYSPGPRSDQRCRSGRPRGVIPSRIVEFAL